MSAIPPRLADRPTDERGRVIPWMAPTIDGRVRFGMNHDHLRVEALTKELCGQCGAPLAYWKWFIGDDEVKPGMTFIEPAMHEECMRYALEVCPFLAHPNYGGSDAPYLRIEWDTRLLFVNPSDRHGPERRPERMSLVKVRAYKVVRWSDGLWAARIANPVAVEWF